MATKEKPSRYVDEAGVDRDPSLLNRLLRSVGLSQGDDEVQDAVESGAAARAGAKAATAGKTKLIRDQEASKFMRDINNPDWQPSENPDEKPKDLASEEDVDGLLFGTKSKKEPIPYGGLPKTTEPGPKAETPPPPPKAFGELTPAEQLKNLHDRILGQKAELMKAYREDKDQAGWYRIAELLAHSLTKYAAAREGLRSGQDLSNLKIQGADWKSYMEDLNQSVAMDSDLLDQELKLTGGRLESQIASEQKKKDTEEERAWRMGQDERSRQFQREEASKNRAATAANTAATQALRAEEKSQRKLEQDRIASEKEIKAAQLRTDAEAKLKQRRLDALQLKQREAAEKQLSDAYGIISQDIGNKETIKQLSELKLPPDIVDELIANYKGPDIPLVGVDETEEAQKIVRNRLNLLNRTTSQPPEDGPKEETSPNDGFVIVGPDGNAYSFPDQKSLDAFKKAANL